MALANVRIVLLRTRTARNVGSVARAMKCFGLDELALVDLRASSLAPAEKTAVSARDVVARARRFKTLRAAVRDATWVVATSTRPGDAALDPIAVAHEVHARARDGRVAIVFGDERHGMRNTEIAACHARSTIATSDALASLNLAHAVLVYAQEIHRARARDGRSDPVGARPRRKSDDDRAPASEREYQTIEKLVRLVLTRTTIRDLDRPGHGVVDLVRGLRRGALTRKDARLWQLALSRTARALGVDVDDTLRAALRSPPDAGAREAR